MSEYIHPPAPENDDNIENQYMVVYALASLLEGYARLYSADYDEGLEDGVSVEQGTIDLGGEIKTKASFSAERLRMGLKTAITELDDVAMTQYKISSTVRREGVPYATLPPEIYEYIDQFEDFNTADYDDRTPVALEYEQTYTLDTDGDMAFENSLNIFVDGEGVMLPDNPADLMPDDAKLDASYKEPDDDMFANIFNQAEMTALLNCSRDVENEHRFNHPLYRFYELMEDMQYLSTRQRTVLARTIVEAMFSAGEE